MGQTAIILGATGLTGSHLLDMVLNDSFYDKIVVFGRSSLGITHPKLESHIIDVLELEQEADRFKADVVFCCIGTTKAKTPDMGLYRAIDYGIPVTAAKLCKTNKIPCFVVMSSLGADKTSNIFYNMIKGEMEAAVLEQGVPRTYILQPSIILGDRNEKRRGESIAKLLMTLIAPLLLGKLKRYRPIASKTIAKAMANLPKGNREENTIPSHLIKEIASHGS